MISETKIHESFPYSQFKTDGLSMHFHLDRNDGDGEILVNSRNNNTVELLKLENLPFEIETFFVLLNIKSNNDYSVVNIALINLL